MPVNETFPLDDLRKAMQDYQRITGNRITIEYALFGGVNDSVEHARLLLRYLKGIHVFINLIPYNSVDGRYERPSAENVLKFRSVLETAGFEAEIREELGTDIDAACGQLRRKTKAGEPCLLESAPKAAVRDEGKKKEPHPPKRNAAASRKTTAPARAGRYPGEVPQKKERAGTKASGGFVEERRTGKPAGDKRRKADAPAKDRYRSGKMKEERPVYRAAARDNMDDSPGSLGEKRTEEVKRSTKRTAAPRSEGKVKQVPEKRKRMPKTALKDKRQKRS